MEDEGKVSNIIVEYLWFILRDHYPSLNDGQGSRLKRLKRLSKFQAKGKEITCRHPSYRATHSATPASDAHVGHRETGSYNMPSDFTALTT